MDKWWDNPCIADNNVVCACELTNEAYFVFRGLCPTSSLRSGYVPSNQPSHALSLVNILGNNHVKYDNQISVWKISNTNASASILIGKQNWTIQGDGCNMNSEYTAELKFTRCDPEGEFTCNDGLCIRMEERCDRKLNCRDHSDEDWMRLLGHWP